MPCQILVLASGSLDANSNQSGDIMMVVDDEQFANNGEWSTPWGSSEVPPNFYHIRVPDAWASDVQPYAGEWWNQGETVMLRLRQCYLPYVPSQWAAQLTDIGHLVKNWAEVKALIIDKATGQTAA